MTHSPSHTALAWREMADGDPKRAGKIIVAYHNEAGHWRRVMAKFYAAGMLDASEDCLDAGTDQDGYAPEGWYEEGEAYEALLPLEQPPEYWMPLPSPPTTEPPQSINSKLLEAAKAILEFVEGQQCYERSPEGYPEGPADDYTHESAHLTMKLRTAISNAEKAI